MKCKYHVKRQFSGFGEMVCQLKALAVLPENPGLIFSTHTLLITIYNSSFRGFDTLFGPPEALDAHSAQTKHIRNKIKEESNLEVSVGWGHSLPETYI